MICIRCGKLNSSNSSKCGSCGAVLPRNYGQSDSSSLLSLEDGRNYEPPDRVYPNTAIQGLEEALAVHLEEDGPEQDVYTWLAEIEKRTADLLSFMPQASEAIRGQQEADPDDLPHRIGYLLQVGIQRFNDATQEFREKMAGDDVDFDDVLDELQLANDFICHSATLVGELFAREGVTVSLVAEGELESQEEPAEA
ncbi:hypothetical protein IV102_13830 [bacterium]|nr:hypothetical protein [bacterium]